MTYHVQWSQIEAECGDYRAGFVDTFRKYEGMETDERDNRGIVKVTVSSFARHLGISESTFRAWIKVAEGDAISAPRSENRGPAGAARRFASKLPATEKAKLAAELLEDDEVEVAPAVIARQAARPDVARAIARYDDAREAVEDEAIEHRATQRIEPSGLDPKTEGRRVGNAMARRMDTDLATGALRNAAGALAEAILCKEEFGIEYPDQEAEALARVEHYLAAYKGEAEVTNDDRRWLDEIGVSS